MNLKSLMDIKLKSISKSNFGDYSYVLNKELKELKWNEKNTKTFVDTLSFIFKQSDNYLEYFINFIDADCKAYNIFVDNFLKDKYPMLYLLSTKYNVEFESYFFNHKSLIREFLMMNSTNINDYLKKYFGISSKSLSVWLGKNLVKNNVLNVQYLVMLQFLSLKLKDEKNKDKSTVILNCLDKAKNENKLISYDKLITKEELSSFALLESVKNITPWKLILLLCDTKGNKDYGNLLKDTLRMSKDIVKFNLQEITVQRKNLSIKTLHDNLSSLIENKGAINFKFKKDNLISKTKISKYNKKSSKYKFIIPNTNREVFKWGSELGHCLGTARYGEDFKKDNIVILAVYQDDKLKYALDISTINKNNLHKEPGILNHIEGKSGIPNGVIYQEIRNELKSIGIIRE